MSWCHTGDKPPYVPQSDDQFFVQDYAIRHGLEFSLHRSGYSEGVMAITVPALKVFGALPFDFKLHEVVLSLTFKCACCGGVFEKAWSDEEMQAEATANGFDSVEEVDIVCDECFGPIMDFNHHKVGEAHD